MEATGIAGTLLLAVVVSSTLARLLRLPLPLVQMALGAAIYGLGLAAGVLDPALFFLLFLPPLLFIDGWRIPQDALRRDAGTILAARERCASERAQWKRGWMLASLSFSATVVLRPPGQRDRRQGECSYRSIQTRRES